MRLEKDRLSGERRAGRSASASSPAREARLDLYQGHLTDMEIEA